MRQRPAPFALALALALGIVLSLGASPRAQDSSREPAPAAPEVPSPSSALLEKGDYAQALAGAEAELAKAEGAASAAVQVEALMGLGRYSEAARQALKWSQKFPAAGRLRVLMGECAFRMGSRTQAVRLWSPLLSDPTWGEVATVRSVEVLSMTGDADAARSLLTKALASIPAPSRELCGLALEVSGLARERARALARLGELNPGAAKEYAALKAFYDALGDGPVVGVTSARDLRAEVPLKEKTEIVDTSSLSWEGSGDSKTLRMGSGARVVLPVDLGDSKERWMSLETGAGTMMVSPAAAQQLGLQAVSSRVLPGRGLLGSDAVDWVLLRTVKVGPVTLTNVPAVVIQKRDAAFWKEASGVFPVSLLGDYALLYDRRGGKLGILPTGSPAEGSLGEGTARLKSLWPAGRPFVEARVQDRDGALLLMDTGALPTWLNASSAHDLGVQITTSGDTDQLDQLLSRGLLFPVADRLTAPLPTTPAPGGVGTNPASGTAVTSLSWGGQSVGTRTGRSTGMAKGVRIAFAGTRIDMPNVLAADLASEPGVECAGILGRSVLDLFTIFLDYRANAVAMKEYKKAR